MIPSPLLSLVSNPILEHQYPVQSESADGRPCLSRANVEALKTRKPLQALNQAPAPMLAQVVPACHFYIEDGFLTAHFSIIVVNDHLLQCLKHRLHPDNQNTVIEQDYIFLPGRIAQIRYLKGIVTRKQIRVGEPTLGIAYRPFLQRKEHHGGPGKRQTLRIAHYCAQRMCLLALQHTRTKPKQPQQLNKLFHIKIRSERMNEK